MVKRLMEKFSLKALLQGLRKNRILVAAYGGGFLACCLLFLLWIVPLRDSYNDTKARIDSTKMLIEKYRSKLKEAEALKGELEKRRGEVEKLKANLYRGQDPLELATSLSRVAGSGEGKGSALSVRSYQISSTKDYQLYREVEFRFVLDADIYGLYSLLKWLDESPAFIVRQINVRYLRRGENETGLMVNLVLTVLMEKKG